MLSRCNRRHTHAIANLLLTELPLIKKRKKIKDSVFRNILGLIQDELYTNYYIYTFILVLNVYIIIYVGLFQKY